MDLEEAEVNELFDRAHILWEIHKSETSKSPYVYVDCPRCGHGTCDIESEDEDGWYEIRCRGCWNNFKVDPNGIVHFFGLTNPEDSECFLESQRANFHKNSS